VGRSTRYFLLSPVSHHPRHLPYSQVQPPLAGTPDTGHRTPALPRLSPLFSSPRQPLQPDAAAFDAVLTAPNKSAARPGATPPPRRRSHPQCHAPTRLRVSDQQAEAKIGVQGTVLFIRALHTARHRISVQPRRATSPPTPTSTPCDDDSVFPNAFM
jgi:hypothetical protein